MEHNIKTSSIRRRLKKCLQKTCSVKTVKRRLPIIEWFPKYNVTTLIQDLIAGVTVGLTAIPQGIAYAVVAGLSPEYGLYSGLLGGFIYLLFGSCKDITVGPTAVMSALVAKYVSNYSADFAVLAAFLSGVVAFVMGVLHLGFLVDFISQPVISGFTTAAAFQISASQLKSLLGLAGSSGNYFIESVDNFLENYKSAKLWDSILGCSTVIILLVLKKLGQGCKKTDNFSKQIRWFVALARNAIVVILGMILAYILKEITEYEPITLIGEIGQGLPEFKPPPFTTTVRNETYSFTDMLSALGPESIVLPLVAILESVAIAKAFAGGIPVDATQEMMAIGLCNILGSFVSSMPVTGSFTRTALNYASGVQTPAGGIFTGILILLSLGLLTSTFYFIPKPTLAGLILTAMFSMVDYETMWSLWKNSKRELFVMLVTIAVSLFLGLEYGVVTGIVLEGLMLLYNNSKPTVELQTIVSDKGQLVIVPLLDSLFYCSASNIRKKIIKATCLSYYDNFIIVIDGSNLKSIDTTVASNIMSVVRDLRKKGFRFAFLNFKVAIKEMCVSINPGLSDLFVTSEKGYELIHSLVL